MKALKNPTVPAGQVLLCAPFGKDAEILTEIASSEGLCVTHCASLNELARRFSERIDFILLTEEALVSSSLQAIQRTLRKQEPWSDIPIILLASAGPTPSRWTTTFVSKLASNANISILERPVRVPTIISVLSTAKRARSRQRQVQGLLLQEKESASNLRSARDQLEQRVKERTFELLRTNDELTREIKERERAESDLRSLSAKVLTIQDEERRRFARDLHDGVGQTLTAALMAVSQATSCPEPLPTACQSGLRDVENLLQQAVREVRTVSHLLHPPLLDESGLLSAAQWYAEGFSRRSGIKLTLELDEQTDRFGPDVETGLFRIIQEALTNVHRHSQAGAVHIKITSRNGRLALRIQDDGKGIPSDVLRMSPKGAQGVGLSSMRERSALLGGTFNVETNRSGTLIEVSVPLQIPKSLLSA
ncbi:MAG TPA: sensor histidine kinase [Terriglobales bacterium]|jgi:signal transduction histidine kinase